MTDILSIDHTVLLRNTVSFIHV